MQWDDWGEPHINGHALHMYVCILACLPHSGNLKWAHLKTSWRSKLPRTFELSRWRVKILNYILLAPRMINDWSSIGFYHTDSLGMWLCALKCKKCSLHLGTSSTVLSLLWSLISELNKIPYMLVCPIITVMCRQFVSRNVVIKPFPVWLLITSSCLFSMQL